MLSDLNVKLYREYSSLEGWANKNPTYKLTNMWALTWSDPTSSCSRFPSSRLCRSRQGWSPTVEYREIALWLIFSFAAAHEPVRHQQHLSRSAYELSWETWAASPHFHSLPANKLNIEGLNTLIRLILRLGRCCFSPYFDPSPTKPQKQPNESLEEL